MHKTLVNIPAGKAILAGNLTIPKAPKGVIVFAHGSGSSRLSPRNMFVAEYLAKAGFATLLFDLMTPREESELDFDGRLRFDIGFLSDRLSAATDFVIGNPDTKSFGLGYFGASTGAAAALEASVRYPHRVQAVVSRGGRPDLATYALSRVQAPTLLIVGGDDTEVISLNRGAMRQMKAKTAMEIVPGAGHLFEEPGALQKVAMLAAEWFSRYMARVPLREQAE